MYLFPFSRFVVYEESMLPVYKPGDHVLTFNWGKVVVGDVVVFVLSNSHPELARPEGEARRVSGSNVKILNQVQNDKHVTYFIKRVYKYIDNYLYVSGTNKAKSTKIYKVKGDKIMGKVILKY